MKKIFVALLVVFGFSLSLPAQSEKTILFLIPFFNEQYNPNMVKVAKKEADMDAIASFKMMGFWNGAQMALDEYGANGVPLKVIVKDVSDNEAKLRIIMDNKALMQKVDLIIAPLLSKQFNIASRYAKEYNIPIVNPFTTRVDFLANNHNVYKLTSSLESRPATVSYISSMSPKSQIVVYADTNKKDKEFMAYRNYFKRNAIPHKMVHLTDNLLKYIKNDVQNIVVILDNDAARSHTVSSELIYKANLEKLYMIVPEDWIEQQTYDIEYYSRLNLHFFSDYYIDYASEQTKVFINNYIERYKVHPTLKDYAYQGYDITRFFVEFIRNDNDLDRVKVEPVAFRFVLDKSENGGFENVNLWLLEVKDNEIIPSGF